MEDRLLKFACLMEARNFTKAAQRLHISQPALTSAVKKLERELQAELIVRSSRDFTPTQAGMIAYEKAKEMEVSRHNLRLRLLEVRGGKAPLALGMIDSVANLLFVNGNYLHELKRAVRLSLTVNNSTELIKLTAAGELDLALLGEPPSLPDSLCGEFLAEEPLVLVIANANYSAVLTQLHRKAIRHFLAYNQNSQTFRLIEQHFSRHGITLEPVFYSTSPEIMLQLVREGQGTAVLPYSLVKTHLESTELAIAALEQSMHIGRRIISLRRKGRTIPHAATQLLTAAQKELQVLLNEVQLLWS